MNPSRPKRIDSGQTHLRSKMPPKCSSYPPDLHGFLTSDKTRQNVSCRPLRTRVHARSADSLAANSRDAGICEETWLVHCHAVKVLCGSAAREFDLTPVSNFCDRSG